MSSERFRFGLFEFDIASRELRREGALVRLQSQPAQVLSCLILRAGHTVSREELRKAVWGAETFVDFDRGLNFCIAQIRQALRDDSVTPRYVQTLPKRGYQFIAPTERISANGEPTAAIPATTRFPQTAVWVGAGFVLLTLAVGLGYWIRSHQASKRVPIVAVLKFDNETSDPGITQFSDGLTDNVVERLTALSLGKYAVVGNAHILRLPRDQRDLSAIASSLHASYVVLGQVQNNGGQSRILVHLIRLPDQTHLWVARLDRKIEDSDTLQIEAEAAQKVGAEFADRIVKDSSGKPSPEAPSQ
jgi:DNA-binding winged helix-turn-helix (wHTH) protein/TolB-like protein